MFLIRVVRRRYPYERQFGRDRPAGASSSTEFSENVGRVNQPAGLHVLFGLDESFMESGARGSVELIGHVGPDIFLGHRFLMGRFIRQKYLQ